MFGIKGCFRHSQSFLGSGKLRLQEKVRPKYGSAVNSGANPSRLGLIHRRKPLWANHMLDFFFFLLLLLVNAIMKKMWMAAGLPPFLCCGCRPYFKQRGGNVSWKLTKSTTSFHKHSSLEAHSSLNSFLQHIILV